MNIIARIILFLQCFYSIICIDYDGWMNIKIQHSLNCGGSKFCPRGSINIRSLRAGTAVIDQINFNKDHIADLKILAEEDGFYTLKTIVTSSITNKPAEFLSSMKADAYLQSHLSDVINLWLLPNGRVVSVNFQPKNGTKVPKNSKEELPITSDFFLQHIEYGPVPDTASFIQKLEREREAKERGEVKDNRSFLAKYWMYIVPIAIFVMISGASNPEAGPAAR